MKFNETHFDEKIDLKGNIKLLNKSKKESKLAKIQKFI